MNTESNAMQGSPLDSQGIEAAVLSATRPMYWSVRRELWENRSIYIAPLAAAALFLFGFTISLTHFPARMRAAGLDPARQHELMEQPYMFAAFLLMGITLVVAVFYCLDALYGERRDRSILFWKSLPVSDLTIVFSKAIIPIVLLPLITFAITVVLWFIMRVLSNAVLMGSGMGAAAHESHGSVLQMSLMLFYHLMAIHGLWYAPFYGWLLLVSAWARRAPFLWAALPPIAIAVFEKITFNTSYFAHMLGYRFGGGADNAGSKAMGLSAALLTHTPPTQLFSNPGLWIGLALMAAFLVAAMRLRRHRDPI
jgi:ABC-2 type transport system permease protein